MVSLFKEALAEQYSSVDDDAVDEDTGEADRPLGPIRRYRNRRLPSVAVTVDLLTTGIDVPKISNLVFLRRVKSHCHHTTSRCRRGTRLCPDIGKERFRIFDAVDLSSLQRPADRHGAGGGQSQGAICRSRAGDPVVHERGAPEGVARRAGGQLQRKKRLFEDLSGSDSPQLRALGRAAGLPAGAPIEEIARWLDEHGAAIGFAGSDHGGGRGRAIVSVHEDGVVEVSRGYGDAERPEDYLDAFAAFLRENLNHVPALLVVTQRPPRSPRTTCTRFAARARQQKGSAS
ncbi:MAG: hypothetical protein R3F14_12570 [Polyangiaceae bacterium]